MFLLESTAMGHHNFAAIGNLLADLGGGRLNAPGHSLLDERGPL